MPNLNFFQNKIAFEDWWSEPTPCQSPISLRVLESYVRSPRSPCANCLRCASHLNPPLSYLDFFPQLLDTVVGVDTPDGPTEGVARLPLQK